MFPKFDYFAPTSINETLTLLEQNETEARILAGGTDILVNLRARVERATCLIDVKNVEALQSIRYDEKQGLTIGAAVSLRKVIESETVGRLYPILRESASSIADFTVRNRATLVGNICNASPAADTAPALLVLDAVVSVANTKVTREVPINEFFTGVKKTVLQKGEFVTSVSLPQPPEGSKGEYLKARRVMGEDVAVVGAAGLATPNGNDCKNLRLAYASVAPTPVRAFEAESIFLKDKPSPRLLEQAMPLVMKTVSPISDVRGGKEYRTNLVRVLTKRLAEEVWMAN